MKIILVVLSVVISSCVFALTPSNTNLNAYEKLCSNALPSVAYDFNLNNSVDCINGNALSVYYVFQASQTVNDTLFKIIGATNNLSIYGPFDSESQLVAQYVQGNVFPINNNHTYSNKVCAKGTIIAGKFYCVVVKFNNCNMVFTRVVNPSLFTDCSTQLGCEDCIQKFEPSIGKYVLSAWLKEPSTPTSATTYTHGYISVKNGQFQKQLLASGQIIDGWQRIEDTISIVIQGQIKIELLSTGGEVLFDDIRIFPVDGSAITYVYDPLTLRLMAELDERNYAKLYEYDEEGKLIRVKKETEKGIMTIQENRENTSNDGN